MKQIYKKWLAYLLMMSPAIQVYNRTTKAIDPYDTGIELTSIHLVMSLSFAMLAGPAGRYYKRPQAFKYKQPLGLAAFTWAILHVLVYFVYNQSEFTNAAIDIIQKPSIIIGAVAFIILMIMAATSFKQAIKFLGKRWKVLHSLGIIAVALGFAHGISFQKTTATFGATISVMLLIVIAVRYYIQLTRTRK